jgi:branched-chain amino acid transport system permease protein
MQMEVADTNISATGARFLLDSPAVDLEDRVFEAFVPQEDEDMLRLLSRPLNTLTGVIGETDLVLAGGILALLAGLWAFYDPKLREIAALVAALGGILALLYFATFFAENRYSSLDVSGFMGLGFWLALFSAVGLLLQAFLPRPPQETTPRIEFLKRTLWNNRMFIAILILLIILPHAIGWYTNSSPFPTARGRTNVTYLARGLANFWMLEFVIIFAIAMLVMSYNLMFGFTGVISFGHALFFGFGAYAVGVMAEFSGLDPNTAFLAAVVITIVGCALIGLAVGLVSLRLRGIYFAIFTLAVAEAAWIFVRNWGLTNGDDGFGVGDTLPTLLDPVQSRLTLYYIALGVFVLSFLFIQKLVNSPTGTVFKAIRENEERARAIGYSTIRYKLLSIMAASVIAGLAGILFGIANKQGLSPKLFSVEFTVDALLMTIIGGVGTLTGPVIGAAGLDIANVVFRDSETEIFGLVIGENWLLITGIIFVIVVLVFPYGIVGTWHRIQMWWKAQTSKPMSTGPAAPVAPSDPPTNTQDQPSARDMIEGLIYDEERSTRSPT